MFKETYESNTDMLFLSFVGKHIITVTNIAHIAQQFKQ